MGWDMTTVDEVGLRGGKDPRVLNKAQEMGAVLVTRDLEFGDIRKIPPSDYKGIIVLKMTYRNSNEVHHVLKKMLRELNENEFAGSLFVVDRNKWRKRTRP